MILTTPNLKPVEFSQGDTPTLTFLATDDQGNPQDLTGYTIVLQAQGPNGSGVYSVPSIEVTLADQVATPGQFSVALVAADTNGIGTGQHKEILAVATNLAGNVVQYRGMNLLTVYSAVPIQ